MITLLRTLYNNGDNDGTITIVTNDKKHIACHSFIIECTSEFLRSVTKSENFKNVIEIDSTYELVNIVLNYLYSEKIVDKELSAIDIINLYNLINQLRCNDSIVVLKNHYLKKFPNLLNEENWIQLLTYIFNVNKYADLQEIILSYYRNKVLDNIESFNLQIINEIYKGINEEIKNLLFSICLEKIFNLTNEIKNNTNDQYNKNKQKLNSYLKNIKCDSDENEEINNSDDDIEEEQSEMEVKKSIPVLKKAVVKKSMVKN